MAKKETVKIEIWGIVPRCLDDLIASGLWGDTREEVYYNLAMDRLKELLSERLFVKP